MEKDIFNINQNELTYGRGYVYSLQYQLVWCTKYRKKVLKDGIDTECKEMLQDLAEEYKFQILAMEVMPDHIHLLVYIEGQKEKEKSLTEEMVCWRKRDADSIQLWHRSTKTEYSDPPDTGTLSVCGQLSDRNI